MCQPVLVLPHSSQKLLHLPYHLNDENCATSRMKDKVVSAWIRHLWTGRLNVVHKFKCGTENSEVINSLGLG